MNLIEVFTQQALAHYNSSNGTRLDGRKDFVSPSLICTCSTCVAIRLWREIFACPTCKRPYEGS